MRIEHELLHKIISNYYISAIPNFYLGAFECDLFTLNKNLYTTEYEIKCSESDYKNDFKKETSKYSWEKRLTIAQNKHDLIREGRRTNRFYFVVNENIKIEVPKYAGLMTFKKQNGRDRASFECIKKAPLLHKNTATNDLILKCLSKLSWRYYGTTRGQT